jgi:hypothetical protein
MSKLVINTGTTPNDGTGDSLLAGAGKINSNFTEIYSSIGDGTTLGIASFTQLNVSGASTLAGITTVTGVTLFSKQLNVSGVSTFAGITTVTGVTLFSKQLNVSGVSTITTVGGTNVTYTTGNFTTGNIVTGVVTNISGTNLNYTGIATVGSVSIGATQVISSGRQLQNIASLDATTTATIESAVANAPNTFTDLNISGLSTFAGITTVTGVSLFTRQLSVSGVSTFAGITTYTSSLFGTQGSFSGIVTANSFRPSSGYIQAADGTNSFFIYSTTGNVAFQGTIGASQLNSASGNKVIGLAGTDATFENNVSVSGVSTFAGITTVTGVTLFSKQLNVSGVSTLGTVRISSGIVTATSGVVTYYGDGSKLTGISAGGGSQWVTTSSGIHTLSNVGIGTTNPTSKLFLDGVIGFVNSNIRIGSDQTLPSATGSSNIAIGNFAGNPTSSGTRNVFIGEFANAFGLDGSYNVMVGYRGSSQGSHNIHIGEYHAGGSGNYNVVIGNGDAANNYNFGVQDPSKDLQFAIGVNTTSNNPTDSRYWLVGNEQFNVGIGTANPSEKFEVVGGEIKAGRVDSTNEGGQVSFGRATDNATAWYIDAFGNTSTPSLRFVDVSNSAVRATIDSAGNIIVSGIATVGLGATSTPPNNSQMSFELTSNTNLRIKVRGTDGVLRSANITLA